MDFVVHTSGVAYVKGPYVYVCSLMSLETLVLLKFEDILQFFHISLVAN